MTGPGTGTGPSASNVSQACAACKHQRRKCVPDCPLAPFFPPNSHKDFLNSHKLFGVRNIMNTVRKVEPLNRENAVKSMIFEANIRAHDPVGGCCRIVKELELKISQAKAELNFVLHQLAMFRAHDQIQNPDCCFYDDGMQNGFEGEGIQQPSYYYIGESSSNIGESSSNKSIHMEALAAMKPISPSPPTMEALSCAKQGNLEKNKKGESEDIKPIVDGIG